MSKKFAWATDLHLNFVGKYGWNKFKDQVKKYSPNGLLISGDIAEATTISSYLKKLNEFLKIPIYFVLGNHDFYDGSISKVREEVDMLMKKSYQLYFLVSLAEIKLNDDVALIGHSGWADGRLGNYEKSPVFLNDYIMIEEFKSLLKSQRLELLNELGNESAANLKDKLEGALEEYSKIILLTHVPPFKESCWHEGKISDENYLPHFSCKSVGDTLKSVMGSHPDSYLTVLCGHTHSAGEVKVLPNLRVLTAGAEYGIPRVEKVINL